MPLKDLPNEIFLNIFQNFDDVLDYISVATCCKKFQKLVKQLVVVIGDGPIQTSTFKHITDTYIQLNIGNANELSSFKPLIEKYKHIIFEYGAYSGVYLHKFIGFLSEVKDPNSKITELVLNTNATRHTIAMSRILDEVRKSPFSYLFEVHRTIFLNESDKGFLLPTDYREVEHFQSLVCVARTYNINSVKILPLVSVIKNPNYSLVLHASKLEKMQGCFSFQENLSISNENGRIKTFCDNSTLPNIEVIGGISMSKKISLKFLEKFTKLRELSLIFNKDFDRIEQRNESVNLPSLEFLKVSGVSIVLYNMNLTNLKELEIEVFSSSIQKPEFLIGNLNLPNLNSLSLRIPLSCSRSMSSILNDFKNELSFIEKLLINGDLRTGDFHELSLENVRTCIFRGNLYTDTEIGFEDIGELPNRVNSLYYLEISNLYNFQNLFFFLDTTFSRLETVVLVLDFKHLNLNFNYVFEKNKFSVLKHLNITTNELLNDTAFDIKKKLKITIDIPTLLTLHSSRILLEHCIHWVSENNIVQITTT